MSVNIHTGTKQSVHLIFYHFDSGIAVKLLHQLFIERAGKQGSAGKAEGLHSAVKAHTGRTVRAASAGNSKVFQRLGNTAEGRRRSRCHLGTAHSFPSDDTGQILIVKLCNEVVHGYFSVP